MIKLAVKSVVALLLPPLAILGTAITFATLAVGGVAYGMRGMQIPTTAPPGQGLYSLWSLIVVAVCGPLLIVLSLLMSRQVGPRTAAVTHSVTGIIFMGIGGLLIGTILPMLSTPGTTTATDLLLPALAFSSATVVIGIWLIRMAWRFATSY